MVRKLSGAVSALLATSVVAWSLPVLVAFVMLWVKPKLWLLPPRLTNNNWTHSIHYRSADGRYDVECGFHDSDSLPYWEGDDEWEDEEVCSKVPVYLHQGPPPEVIRVSIDGRLVELRAPFFLGRLF